LRITKKLDELIPNEHDKNLKLSVFILKKGLLEQRESEIRNLRREL
jgi:hypothetical protein